VWRVLGGEDVEAAIDAPRLHVDGATLHVEGGWGDGDELWPGWDVVRWEGLNLYFGGVGAVAADEAGSLSAAGDPRRGGAGLVIG
jgi:gamma-glutamyltranspeptidase/glutathione hydrolase